MIGEKPILFVEPVIRRLKHSYEGVPTGLYYTQRLGSEAYIYTNNQGWWNIPPGSLSNNPEVDEGNHQPTTGVVASFKTPPHYDKKVSPWDLEKCMESSGNAFVDARRTDIIEYAFRNKGDMIGDLRKAMHNCEEAIKVLEALQPKIK
jgi:hypothetical protein